MNAIINKPTKALLSLTLLDNDLRRHFKDEIRDNCDSTLTSVQNVNNKTYA